MALRSLYRNGAVALTWRQEPHNHDRYLEEAWEPKIVARGFQAMHTEDDGSDALQAVPVAHARQPHAEWEFLESVNGKRKQVPLMRKAFPQEEQEKGPAVMLIEKWRQG